ncbi:DUF6701 domain-containing protein [Uliginosibacterium paludis]|uniref:DUF6701 domain-containing protein n=1 Tax=Uliginosibacterium paludis TaxID=1615952 RepID=A0ABV2CVS0_9RHOO
MSRTAAQIGATFIIKAAPAPTLTCVSDNFNRSSGIGTDWVATKVSGSFTPSIVSNRLRLTEQNTQQSTAVSFQRLFPGAGNYLQFTFKYYAYKSNGSTTNPADGIAVILSDASYTPQPGGFGGSLGYSPKASSSLAGFAGGWLGLGLDEFGNFSNRNDSGPCSPGLTCATSRVMQSVSVRGSSPNYYWIRGTGSLATTDSSTAAVSNSTGHLYRVTVDSRSSGKAMLTVERDTSGTGNSYATIIPSTDLLTYSGQASIPDNFILSLTGSTGDYTNIHEIDDLNVCAQSMNPMADQIDHFRLAVTDTPLTCTPANVQVTACMDATCSKTYSGSITATLTPTGWVGGDTRSFNSGDKLSLSKTTAGSYTLGVSGSTPTVKPFSSTLCSIAGSAYSSNCSLSFSDAGLLYTVPAQTSGVDSADITITAAKTDDVTKACVPAFTGTRAVKFWSSYVSPASGTMALAVNGTNVATSSSGTSLNLTFDANAQAKLKVNYPDAGQISLNARYDGSTATADSGLVMTGSSTFAVKPYALCVDSSASGWAACSATPAAMADPAACAKWAVAGSAFNLRVTGKAATSGQTDACKMNTTPNYIQSGIVLSSTVIAPSGGQNGDLSVKTTNITSGGTATVSTTLSEVGMFTLSATPPASAYFGLTVPAGSNRFGRFVPAGFNVSGTLTNRYQQSCSVAPSYTYLGEALKMVPSISAVNLAGGITQNYMGNYARLALSPVSGAGANGLAFGAQSGTTLLNSRLSATCVTCGSFANGSATASVALTVGRDASGAVDGPFSNAQIGLSLTDPDGVTVLNPDYRWSLSGSPDAKLLGSTVLNFGRMRVENAYGTSLVSLPVPAYVQIWNGTSFVKQTDDSCTKLVVPATISMNTGTTTALFCGGGVGLYGTLNGVAATMNAQVAGQSVALASGDARLVLGKPASGSSGYVDLVLNVPDYLKYNWDSASACSGVAPHDDNPRARIRFGARRNSSVIYQREVF